MQPRLLWRVLIATLINCCASLKATVNRLQYLKSTESINRMSVISFSHSTKATVQLKGSSTVHVETKKDEATLHADLKSSVKEVIKDWKYNDGEIVIRSLSGGITNLLYTLTPKTEVLRTVIVRIYGEGTSLFVDRDVENIVFATLSERGIGPKFYGTFRNGRVEGFCEAKTLKPEEISDREVFPKTSTAIAQLHSQTIPEINQNAMLWTKLESFFDLAEKYMATSVDKTTGSSMTEKENNLASMKEQGKWLKRNMDSIEKKVNADLLMVNTRRKKLRLRGAKFGFDVLLCHNDLLAGNILLSNHENLQAPTRLNNIATQYSVEEKTCGTLYRDDLDFGSSQTRPRSTDTDRVRAEHLCTSEEEENVDTNGITLIDFEYAANNYRAWDIANHFNEFAGFDFNIQKDYPTKERRLEFLKYYVKGYYRHGSSSSREQLTDVVGDVDDLNEFIEGFEVCCFK